MSLDMRNNPFGLPPGDWRYDPARRVQIFVPHEPEAEIKDAFDDVLERPSRAKNRPISHGTEHGYKTHLERGIDVCESCRQAANQASRNRRARRRLNQAKEAA